MDSVSAVYAAQLSSVEFICEFCSVCIVCAVPVKRPLKTENKKGPDDYNNLLELV